MNAEQAQVPDHWGWIPIAELSERLAKGKSPKYGDNGPFVIKTRHVYPRGFPEALSQRSTANYQPEQFVRPNDLLMTAMGRGSIGRLLLVSECTEPMVTDGCILTIRSKAWISPQWLYFFLQSSYGQSEILARETGTAYAKNRGRTQVKPADFGTIQAPIPFPDDRQRSIQEQRRIAACIEALFDRMEEAWRLRIAAEEDAERLMPAALAELFGQTQPEDNWKTVEDLCEIRGGLQKSPKRQPKDNPRPYLRVANVQQGHLVLGDIAYFEVNDSELERYRLLPGDVLIIEGNGSPSLVGRTAIFRGEIKDCVHQNHVIRLRPDTSRILPEALSAYLSSPLGRSIIENLSHTSSGLLNLSIGKIRSIPVPSFPLSKQRHIVDYLDGVQAQVAELKRLQAASAAELARLRGAVLAQAFRGEL